MRTTLPFLSSRAPFLVRLPLAWRARCSATGLRNFSVSSFTPAALLEATCKDYLQVQTEGGRRIKRKLRYYNLEAI